MNKLLKFNVSAIAAGVCLALSGGPILAAEDNDESEEELEIIEVRGARGSQIKSVSMKKEANVIADVISAEDIGKLPDVTISDSLQRISGIQIRRSAGEGSSINVRGLPQVMTQLNGEAYITAGSVTTTQPDFSDIPSQLFSGADVVKSTTAAHLHGGITGIVNLKTRRPFDINFDEGLTTSYAFEGQYGEETASVDPSYNGLVNWTNDKIGIMLSASYSEANLADYYAGLNGNSGWSGLPSEQDHFGGLDVNNNNSFDDRFIVFQGHSAFNRGTERERLGLNAAFQMQLTDAFLLTSELFTTDMDEFDRRQGLTYSDKWQTWGWATPEVSRETGFESINTIQVYNGGGRRLKSFSEVLTYQSESQNFNLELNYDDDGPFRVNTRIVTGSATRKNINGYIEADMADGSQWGVETPLYPDGVKASNPDGYTGIPNILIDYRNEFPVWSNVPDFVNNLDGYGIGAISSENNFNRDGDMDVFRTDAILDLETNFVSSVEFGVRLSSRSASNEQYHLLAPINGCLVRWKATDVVLSSEQCSAGNEEGFFTAGNPIPLTDFGDAVQIVSDYGPVSGLPAVYALDPRAMDDVRAFHDSLYPGNINGLIPGRSYTVGLDEQTYYTQVNFEQEIQNIPFSGNIGVRVIETDLDVRRNISGQQTPYGGPKPDIGDEVTVRSYTDVLPAANLLFDLNDNLKLRMAYSKTMTPLDLESWGGGLEPIVALNAETGIFEVQRAVSLGNPNLDPWRADNTDISLEYYLDNGGMINLALFQVKLDSFIETATERAELPDADGVIRREVDISTTAQGEGGSIKGIELGAKLFLDFLPGVLSNTGMDINFTYSPSDSGNQDITGEDLPFFDNSERQFNFVLWYQDDAWQARVATNYRSERVAEFDQVWSTPGLTLFQEATTYVDASLSYRFDNGMTVFMNASNVTGEYEKYYFQWEDQFAYQNIYETRYTVGLRGSF